MNVSRRPGAWRLVAMLVIGCTLTATGALAQTQRLRVKIGPANIYERPRTSSDVIMVAPEGTVLDVLSREDTWYWVLLPADGNGLRRAGYIAVYLVELIAPKGPDVTPRTGPALATKPPVAKPATPASRKTPRYLIGIGLGGQTASPAFADTVQFQLYDETGHYLASYATPSSTAFDATAGVRFGEFVLAVSFWHATPIPSAGVVAVVPHPIAYNNPRLTTAEGVGVNRLENDGHLQLTWLIPLSSRVDLSIYAGPSIFYVRQDMISSLSLRESFPYDTVGISGFQTVRKSDVAFGGNVGVDVTVMVWRFAGVGVSGRYSRGTADMPSADAGTVKVRAGGAQISGGLRMRF